MGSEMTYHTCLRDYLDKKKKKKNRWWPSCFFAVFDQARHATFCVLTG